jgi:hypothetical protein
MNAGIAVLRERERLGASIGNIVRLEDPVAAASDVTKRPGHGCFKCGHLDRESGPHGGNGDHRLGWPSLSR